MNLDGMAAPDIDDFVRANPYAMTPDASFGIAPGQGEYMYEKDTAIAAFYMQADIDKIASKEAGAPRYKRMPYIEIRQPGENLNIIRRPVTQTDMIRFADGWKRFQERMDGEPDGTPLIALFPFHPDIVMTLRANSCPTVEALADMSDGAVSTLGGHFSDFRDRARRYLVAISNPNGVKQVQQSHELESLRAENNSLRTLIDQQGSAIKRMEEQLSQIAGTQPGLHVRPGPGDVEQGEEIERQQRRGPGRPRKE